MLYGKYRFKCHFTSPAKLPEYKGSTFRGVFGRALRKVACTQGKPSCNTCKLKNRCLYTLVFETEGLSVATRQMQNSGSPHPFVIEPPLETRMAYRPGDPFIFDLILFGSVNHNLPYFIYAFENMGTIGLGRRLNGRRGKYQLDKVSCGDRVIYTSTEKFLFPSETAANLDLEVGRAQTGNGRPHTVKIKLITPLRLKFKNKYQAKLPFHVLVRSSLRRMSGLLNVYGHGEPPLNYPKLVRNAEKIEAASENIRWTDWRRYSFRQDAAMLMGGLTGEVVYENVPGEYLPLLNFVEATHIGKQSAFGLGKIGMEIV